MYHNKGKHRYLDGREIFTRAANRHLWLPEDGQAILWSKSTSMSGAIEFALSDKLIGEDRARITPIVRLESTFGANSRDIQPVVNRINKFLRKIEWPIDDSLSYTDIENYDERQYARHLALLILAEYCRREYIKFEYEIPSQSRLLRHDGRTGWNL